MKEKLVGSGVALLAIIVIVLLIQTKVGYFQQSRAGVSLATYLENLSINSKKSFCNKDSDGDGYASCSYNNGSKIINLECDSSLFFNTGGCKAPKNMYMQGN